MPRYFIEVAYKGTQYSGFQIQHNAVTIQSEVEKVLAVYYRNQFELTGSSRTDAGVHARQNYFHFDTHINLQQQHTYNLNAILPEDIVIEKIYPMDNEAHCRFDAVSRKYQYFIYQDKNPFLQDRAWFYPYTIDVTMLNTFAKALQSYQDFTSFSKRNTQVKNFNCKILESYWKEENDCLVYTVEANRFLRGMVRALVSTMLKLCKQNDAVLKLEQIILSKDCTNADFTAPSQGLFLQQVNYPQGYFK